MDHEGIINIKLKVMAPSMGWERRCGQGGTQEAGPLCGFPELEAGL